MQINYTATYIGDERQAILYYNAWIQNIGIYFSDGNVKVYSSIEDCLSILEKKEGYWGIDECVESTKFSHSSKLKAIYIYYYDGFTFKNVTELINTI